MGFKNKQDWHDFLVAPIVQSLSCPFDPNQQGTAQFCVAGSCMLPTAMLDDQMWLLEVHASAGGSCWGVGSRPG